VPPEDLPSVPAGDAYRKTGAILAAMVMGWASQWSASQGPSGISADGVEAPDVSGQSRWLYRWRVQEIFSRNLRAVQLIVAFEDSYSPHHDARDDSRSGLTRAEPNQLKKHKQLQC
jgi:hypothetical protein